MKRRLANLLLLMTAILSGIELGGGIYEGLVVFPAWSATPPASFALLQGPNALQLGLFWLPGHILLTLVLIPTLVLNWSLPQRRTLIIIGAIGYLVMRATTFLYFLPELNNFLATPADSPFSPELAERAARWGAWSVARMAVIAALTIVLVVAYSKPDRPSPRDRIVVDGGTIEARGAV